LKIFLLITTAIIILSFFILIVSSTISSDGKQGRPGLNEVSGEVELNHNEFIQISGKDIFGKEISEQDFSEEIIMIDFWASWCPPCIQEAEVLSDASKYWKDKNVRFIGLALWDNENSVKKFVEKHDFKYDIALDKDGKYAISYGVKALPEKFFINNQGKIIKKYIGPIDKNSLDKIFEELLLERK